jgi:hypothetical protein
MANSMFSQFKMMLERAIQDEDFRRKNCLFQDADYLADMVARIRSLTTDVSITQDYRDVISVLGMVEQDTANSRIKFSTRGFDTTLSAFREGMVTIPKKIWFRGAVAPERYIVSDATNGLLVLNDHLEVLYRFPGFGSDIAVANNYDDPSACCTFSIGAVEYLAVAMYSHHCVAIYSFADATFQSLIGVIDTPGADATHLDSPVGVAYDSVTNQLYILNETGQPVDATADKGFISIWNLGVAPAPPDTPVFVSADIYYLNTGSLLDAEVDTPRDMFLDGQILWISNGNNEVGSFDISGATAKCVKYIGPQGHGYVFREPNQICVHTAAVGGYKYLSVANGAYGTIEQFDHLTLAHVNTYGYRASEDNLNTLPRVASSVYGAIGYAQALVADRVKLEGKDTDILICADTLNERVHRFNLNAYWSDNLANFALLSFDTPVMVNGWSLSGDIPTDLVKVFYRFGLTEEFRELSQETSLPATSSIQLRVTIRLDSRKFVKNWYIRYLRIHGVQA